VLKSHPLIQNHKRRRKEKHEERNNTSNSQNRIGSFSNLIHNQRSRQSIQEPSSTTTGDSKLERSWKSPTVIHAREEHLLHQSRHRVPGQPLPIPIHDQQHNCRRQINICQDQLGQRLDRRTAIMMQTGNTMSTRRIRQLGISSHTIKKIILDLYYDKRQKRKRYQAEADTAYRKNNISFV
jgi:hypothetical protein